MANPLLDRIKNTKARTLLILGGFILFVIILIVYFLTRKSDVLESQQSKTEKLPDISSVPGNVTSEKYQQLQEEENKKRAEAAKKSGSSAVATIIGTRSKDSLSGKETFGIEDQFLKSGNCKCPPVAPGGVAALDPALAAKLIAEIEADPSKALTLLKQNPGLGKAICQQKPDLALKIAESDKEAAKIMLNECPEMAKMLADKNPALFKQLMLENPELARKLAEQNPALFKKLMEEDPDFARKLAKSNPELVKTLMKNDPAFADKMMRMNPDMVKELMRNDPTFAAILAKNNPDAFKKLLLDDPEFAQFMARNNPELVAELMKNDPAFAKALREKNPNLDTFLAGRVPTPPTAGKQIQVVTPAEVARPAALTESQQKQLQALMSAMEAQSKAALQSWNEFSTQSFQQGEWARKQDEMRAEEEKKRKEAVVVTTAPGATPVVATAAPAGAMIKAGTILYAVLDTSINSDEPGPVMATIVSGKFKGAKVLGNMTTQAIQGSDPEKVTLNFNLMSIPEAPSSIGIQAVAIDPDTARTAFATSVDRHYLLRYGAIFASAFMTGYSKVITSQGTVQETATNGQSVRTQSPELSGRKQIYAALGDVGKKWGDAVAPLANRPYTIKVKAGIGLGLLFLADVGG